MKVFYNQDQGSILQEKNSAQRPNFPNFWPISSFLRADLGRAGGSVQTKKIFPERKKTPGANQPRMKRSSPGSVPSTEQYIAPHLVGTGCTSALPAQYFNLFSSA